jgi:hypothetical protein
MDLPGLPPHDLGQVEIAVQLNLGPPLGGMKEELETYLNGGPLSGGEGKSSGGGT